MYFIQLFEKEDAEGEGTKFCASNLLHADGVGVGGGGGRGTLSWRGGSSD